MSRLEKKTTAILLIAIFMISTCAILPAFAATEDEIEDSIEKGLVWLADQQNDDGSWGEWNNIAKTGLAVLKFIDYVKEIPDIDSWNDPDYVYHDVVVDGLNFLFSQGYYVNISDQLYGDPDTLVNGKGIRFYGFDDYETSIVLMALGATMTPSLTVTVLGPLNGLTYSDVVQDIVDYLSFNQRESLWARGGWGYEGSPNWADNSVSGYAALGLGYAQAFGATIPQFVKDELTHWIGIIQSPAGYSYYRPPAVCQDPYEDELLRTGNLLYEMALVGMPVDGPNVQAALNFIENNWTLGEDLQSSMQRAYCLMKGLEAYGITDEITVGVSGDWFDELSTYIVSIQNLDGSWPSEYHDEDEPYSMTAAWALLTLEKTVAIPARALYWVKASIGGEFIDSYGYRCTLGLTGMSLSAVEIGAETAYKGSGVFVDHDQKIVVHLDVTSGQLLPGEVNAVLIYGTARVKDLDLKDKWTGIFWFYFGEDPEIGPYDFLLTVKGEGGGDYFHWDGLVGGAGEANIWVWE